MKDDATSSLLKQYEHCRCIESSVIFLVATVSIELKGFAMQLYIQRVLQIFVPGMCLFCFDIDLHAKASKKLTRETDWAEVDSSVEKYISALAQLAFKEDRLAIEQAGITDEIEGEMAKDLLASNMKEFEEKGILVVSTGEEIKEISLIGNKLKAKTRRPIPFNLKYHIVESAELNAMAQPGGYVFVTRGMLKFIDETFPEKRHLILHVVLSHELAHIDRKHSYVKLGLMKELNVIDRRIEELAPEDQDKQAILQEMKEKIMVKLMAYHHFEKLYSELKEIESDLIGLSYVHKLKFKEKKETLCLAPAFWSAFAKASPREEEPKPQTGEAVLIRQISKVLSTHPAPMERSQTIKQYLRAELGLKCKSN